MSGCRNQLFKQKRRSKQPAEGQKMARQMDLDVFSLLCFVYYLILYLKVCLFSVVFFNQLCFVLVFRTQ